MADVVHQIVDALDGITRLATDTGVPPQTISDWLNKGVPEIPPWRRPTVLEVVRRRDIALSSEALDYLCSSERRVRRKVA